MTRIMAFDVETTGLLPKFDKETGKMPPITAYPLILQLSFVIYDIEKQAVVQKYNEYIKVESHIEITPFITGLTGISRELCDDKGIPICQVLRDFCEAYMSVDCVIAHNLFGFDKKMIELEIQRNITKLSGVSNMCFLFNDTFNDLRNIRTCCTMNLGKNICNIFVENQNGTKWKKGPKLVELHEFLFGTKPDGLHDALVDTMVCMKCYLKIKFDIDIQA